MIQTSRPFNSIQNILFVAQVMRNKLSSTKGISLSCQGYSGKRQINCLMYACLVLLLYQQHTTPQIFTPAPCQPHLH